MIIRIAAAVALSAVLAGPASAQAPVTQGAAITETFTVEAIDYTARLVTLRDKDGLTETIVAGPEVQRLDAVKVGDTVTFRYYESIVYAIRKPGAAAKPAESGGITRAPGAKPGATLSQQVSATVTINEIDPKTPSVTVTTQEGRRMGFKVENPKNLEGLKAGDQVEITYTRALAISVAPGK
jgi:Cu/Ag efflux protein CusF